MLKDFIIKKNKKTYMSIKISENCWKHTNKYGVVFYTKTSDPDSELHREDGPAIELHDGSKAWYINGKRHREDGPAVEFADGGKYWYINGKCHRKDGPAIEGSNGTKQWYYHDQFIDVSSKEDFELYIKNLIFI